MMINLLSKESGDALGVMKYSFAESDMAKDYQTALNKYKSLQKEIGSISINREEALAYQSQIDVIRELNSKMNEYDQLKPRAVITILTYQHKFNYAVVLTTEGKLVKALIFSDLQKEKYFITYSNLTLKDIIDIYDKPSADFTLNSQNELHPTVIGNVRNSVLSIINDSKSKINKAKSYNKFKPERDESIKKLNQYKYDETQSSHIIHFAQLINESINTTAKIASCESNRNLISYDEYQARINVLSEMNYIDQNQALTLKGRVAKEIGAQQTILLTELLFTSSLNKLQPNELAAILSFFSQEKNDGEYRAFNENVDATVTELKKVQLKIADLEKKYKVEEGCDWCEGFAEIAYRWASGDSFASLCEECTHEGTIVKNIMKIDYLCKELKIACSIIGSSQLSSIIDETQKLIRRDIIFMPSLYFS